MSSNVFGLGFVDFFFVSVCFFIQLFLPSSFDSLFHLLQLLVFPFQFFLIFEVLRFSFCCIFFNPSTENFSNRLNASFQIISFIQHNFFLHQLKIILHFFDTNFHVIKSLNIQQSQNRQMLLYGEFPVGLHHISISATSLKVVRKRLISECL